MNVWSKEWPDQPGFYWMWGDIFNVEGSPNRLYFVEVGLAPANKGFCPIHYIEGMAFYKGDNVRGVYQKAVLPEPPNEV